MYVKLDMGDNCLFLILCIVFFLFSTSGWCDRGVVCLGDGMGFKHGAGQEFYVALFGKWPAAGHIQDYSMGVWTTVSILTAKRSNCPEVYIYSL